ncbi:MAG: GFA family protein [Novosphingobium sp.]
MSLEGGCQCGAVRYRVSGQPQHNALCHCADCRKSAGAPIVGWAAFAEADFAVTRGEPATFNSSGASLRSFCPTCGTGLFFRNAETLPGIVDIQTATLDDPGLLPPDVQIQVAERLPWMAAAHTLPAFKRYPGMPED